MSLHKSKLANLKDQLNAEAEALKVELEAVEKAKVRATKEKDKKGGKDA